MADLLYISIAKNIEKDIQDGILKENDRLSERKLAEEYGVSRTVIREALKQLSEKGLVEIFSGKGSYVSIPNKKVVMDKVESVIHNSCLKTENIIEAREILETAMVNRVLGRVKKQDIDELQDIIDEMEQVLDDGEKFCELDAVFHLRLMHCAKNEVLELFMGALNGLTDRNSMLGDRERRTSAHLEHKSILYELKNKNRDALNEAVMNHIKCIRHNFQIKKEENE